MKETIKLYNHFHYGDIFLARMLIKGLSEKFNIEFYHNLNVGLFNDIEEINEISGVPNNFSVHYSNLPENIINTWIGQNGMTYVNNSNSPGCNFDGYYRMITDILNYYKIEVREPEYYLPTINYENLPNFSHIREKFLNVKNKYGKCILISNGPVHSGQSSNFDFSSIVIKLANENPNYLFLTTSKILTDSPNIIYTSDLTNTLPDLLYISYFSTKSNVCVGRASGPYTYYMTYENIYDDSKKIISFNNNINEGFFYKNHKFDFIWSNNFDLQNVYSIINNNI